MCVCECVCVCVCESESLWHGPVRAWHCTQLLSHTNTNNLENSPELPLVDKMRLHTHPVNSSGTIHGASEAIGIRPASHVGRSSSFATQRICGSRSRYTYCSTRTLLKEAHPGHQSTPWIATHQPSATGPNEATLLTMRK